MHMENSYIASYIQGYAKYAQIISEIIGISKHKEYFQNN